MASNMADDASARTDAQRLLEAEGNALWTNVQHIGTGGSGSVVFKAFDKYVEEDVALKMTRIVRESDRRRIEREAKALEKIFASDLDDTHICKFYKWGYLAERTWLYIKMEYAGGGTLFEHLAARQEPMAEREVLKTALSILSALATVHGKNLVHRDIKPQNILLVGTEYKLADFGLAFEPTAAAAAPGANTFQTMSFGGTPQYSSPEQLMEQPLTPHTDLWSLAVTMYQCVSGQLPFGEQPMMAVGKILAVKESPPPDLVKVSDGRVSPEVAAIITRAMAFDPADRFPSAAAMADAIRDALSDYDVFISYRRTHQEYGKKIKRALGAHGLKAFLDVDPEDGLTLGPFQAQLERVLEHTPTVFMLITPAPSGPDERATGGIDRSSISSMAHVAAYLKRGWNDWCELEMKRSLELHKEIVPIFSTNVDIGAELGKIGHLDSVKDLRSLNAFAVDVDDVTPGVERIVQHIRMKNVDRSKMSSMDRLKEDEDKALMRAKLISERRQKEEEERRLKEFFDVVRMLTEATDAEGLMQGCRSVWEMIRPTRETSYADANKEHAKALVTAGALEAVIHCMQSHPGHVGVQAEGCFALACLVAGESAHIVRAAEAGGIAAILTAMAQHRDSTEVQQNGCFALGNVACNNDANQRTIVKVEHNYTLSDHYSNRL